MLEAGSVVVGVDPQGVSGAVLGFALEQAHARDVPIDLVSAYQPYPTISLVPVLPDESAVIDAVRRHAEDVLAATAHRLAAQADVPVRRRALEGSTAPLLAACAAEAAVLVLGTHAGSGAWLGPVLGGVLTTLDRPVVCLPDSPTWQPGPVVLATEGTELTSAATDFGFEQAERWSAQVHAVLAVETGFNPDILAESARERYLEGGRRRLSAALVPARLRYPDVEVRESVMFNGLFPALRRAGQGAALLVLGGHGRGAVGRVLLGSVGSSMLRAAACPIAVVRRY